MKSIWTGPVCFLIVVGTLMCALPPSFDLYSFYRKELQMPIFTGFLTIGGFLLTLKTFILVKLKEDLYELPVYQKWHEDRCAIMKKPLPLYAPLSRLGDLLLFSVACALITAVAQLTLGFIPHAFAAAVCLAAGAATMTYVALAWWYIRGNIRRWFDMLEKNEQHRIECKQKQAQSAPRPAQ